MVINSLGGDQKLVKFSKLTQRIRGEGAQAWNIHYRGLERQARGEDVIILSIGDPDFDTPAPVTGAAIDSLKNGFTHYSDVQGRHRLRDIIAKDHQAMCGQAVTAANVAVTAGAQCALYGVAQCILDPGCEIIVPEPMYVAYEGALQANGAIIVRVPLRADREFQLDSADIEQAITPATRAILVNTPHNPTGTLIDPQTMAAIAELCRKHDLWIVSDEVYAHLTFGKTHISPASLPEIRDRTAVIGSLSKSHAMTGWRLGWVVGPEALATNMGYLALCMLYGCPAFTQEAACQAFGADARAASARMREAYQARRDVMVAALAQGGILKPVVPDAGMFVMVDIRATGLSADEFAARLLDDYGVSALAGDAFGPSASGFLRIALTVEAEKLVEASQRMNRCAQACLVST